MNKKCLVIYIGIGYTPTFVKNASGNSYFYATDMRENKQNHQKMIYEPLFDSGYIVDTLLMTSKHSKYQEFLCEYNSISIDYDDIADSDCETLINYFNLKVTKKHTNGFGHPAPGGRFLKLKESIPDYDLYVFIRSDTVFKMSISNMDIDYDKINYLWRETDSSFLQNNDEPIDFFWKSNMLVSGNVLNIVPKKFFKVFTNYYWAEHYSLYLMLNDLHPVITLSDINFIVKNDFYTTDTIKCINPIYTFNKKIMHSDGSITSTV